MMQNCIVGDVNSSIQDHHLAVRDAGLKRGGCAVITTPRSGGRLRLDTRLTMRGESGRDGALKVLSARTEPPCLLPANG
jgi:hypothetical protein